MHTHTEACEEENDMGNIYHCKKRGNNAYTQKQESRKQDKIRQESDTFLAQESNTKEDCLTDCLTKPKFLKQ